MSLADPIQEGLRLLCQRFSCSLAELAVRLGVQERFLVGLQNNFDVPASVVLLIQRALVGDVSKEWRVDRAQTTKLQVSPNGQLAFRAISPTVSEVRMAGGEREVIPPRQGLQCLLFCLGGELEVSSAYRALRLGSGDALTFPSEIVKVQNTGMATARFMIVWSDVTK